MHKILIVYASRSGSTKSIAERMHTTLTQHLEDGTSVTCVAAADAPNPADYDAIILGSGVRAGRWLRAARNWLAEHVDLLKTRPFAIFTVGLTIASSPEKRDEVLGYTAPLLKAGQLEPVGIGLFPGWNEPKAFTLPERLILKAIGAPKGDFRDMNAVDAWAMEVLPLLLATQATT